jgi:hypothetical protein
MDVKLRILRAGSVLAVALAAGHLVQTMKSDVPSASINRAVAGSADALISHPNDTAAVPISASMTSGEGPQIGSSELTAITSVAASAEPGTQQDCGPVLALTAAPGAMIGGTVTAPCNRRERVVISHAGLSFAARTAADGSLSLTLPALEAEALVSVYFAKSEMVIGSISLPDIATVQRFGLQWTKDDAFSLRINEDDNIFVGGRDARHANGVQKIIALGDTTVEQPMFAEVYTYPTNAAAEVDVVVEVAITPRTCGQKLHPEAIVSTGGMVTVEQLDVMVPHCDAAGDILVLKNLAPDLKIAAAN